MVLKMVELIFDNLLYCLLGFDFEKYTELNFSIDFSRNNQKDHYNSVLQYVYVLEDL